MASEWKLTDKQQRFAGEYLIDLNATQAAIRAGYSEKTAKSQGQRLLTKVDVQGEIQRLMETRAKRTNIDQDRVLLEIARLAFCDPRNIFDGTKLKKPCDWDDATAASVSSIKVSTRQLGEGEIENVAEIKFWSKTSALEMASKHLGLFQRDNEQKFDAETLRALLSGLPEEFAAQVKAALRDK